MKKHVNTVTSKEYYIADEEQCAIVGGDLDYLLDAEFSIKIFVTNGKDYDLQKIANQGIYVASSKEEAYEMLDYLLDE